MELRIWKLGRENQTLTEKIYYFIAIFKVTDVRLQIVRVNSRLMNWSAHDADAALAEGLEARGSLRAGPRGSLRRSCRTPVQLVVSGRIKEMTSHCRHSTFVFHLLRLVGFSWSENFC